MSPRDVEKIILADGWRLKNIKGDHYHYIHPTKPGKVTIPMSKKKSDLHPKTVASILKQAGLK
ncbi:MAG: type II toxin-antitoxin system HicA family toxin [Clostridiales bacterium]|nr:type II toxin-antitoxin system HicA family toxin [Clostridiales bacterium]